MKRLFIEIGSVSVVLLLVFAFLFLPAQKKYRQRACMVRDVYQEMQENLPIVMRSGKVEAEVIALSKELGTITKKMTTPVDKGAVATALRRKAEELDLAVIAEEPWNSFRKLPKGEESPWAGVSTRLEKKMTLEGEFASIGRFMEALEAFEVLTRTTSILIRKKDEKDPSDALRVELTMNLYDLHELTLK